MCFIAILSTHPTFSLPLCVHKSVLHVYVSTAALKIGSSVPSVWGRFKREGTYIYLWLIHVDIWQKPTQYCKAINLRLKKKQIKKKKTLGVIKKQGKSLKNCHNQEEPKELNFN